MDTIQINDQILADAIWGASKCSNFIIKKCNGYINSDNGDMGRIIIEHLLSRIYGIHRIPGYEPEYSKAFPKDIAGFNKENLDKAEDELRKVIEHVQNKVYENENVIDGKVTLVRSLRDFEIKEIIPQLLGDEKLITMPSNIMTSYAYDGQLYNYGSFLSVKRVVNVKDIVFWDKYIEAPSFICTKRLHMGEYEVWVVNTDVYGEVELDRSCFYVKEGTDLAKENEKYHGHATRKYRYDNDCEISSVYAAGYKPCEEDDFLTKYVIGKNMKKAKFLYGLND